MSAFRMRTQPCEDAVPTGTLQAASAAAVQRHPAVAAGKGVEHVRVGGQREHPGAVELGRGRAAGCARRRRTGRWEWESRGRRSPPGSCAPAGPAEVRTGADRPAKRPPSRGWRARPPGRRRSTRWRRSAGSAGAPEARSGPGICRLSSTSNWVGPPSGRMLVCISSITAPPGALQRRGGEHQLGHPSGRERRLGRGQRARRAGQRSAPADPPLHPAATTATTAAVSSPRIIRSRSGSRPG